MKFARRFVVEAAVLSAALMLISCSTQGPTAPVQIKQTVDRPIAPVDPSTCDVKLGGSPTQILNNSIPFVVTCEDMTSATMTITRTFSNQLGCAVWVDGFVMIGTSGHRYDFEMFMARSGPECELDGGFIIVDGPQLGHERWLRLPVSTRVSAVTRNVAN